MDADTADSSSGSTSPAPPPMKQRRKTDKTDRTKALARVQHYMIRKGLIDPDVMDRKFQSIIAADKFSSEEENEVDFHSPAKVSKPKKGKNRRKHRSRSHTPGKNKPVKHDLVINSPSEMMIYHNAVKYIGKEIDEDQFVARRSSDEEVGDTSGSLDDPNISNNIEYISERGRTRDRATR